MQATVKFLQTSSRLLLATHDFPDGDGLGSQVALHRALEGLGKTCFSLNPGPTPEKFSLVDPQNIIHVYSAEKPLPEVDAVLILDTNDLKMMGPMESVIRTLGKPLIFVDHHVPEAVAAGPHFMDESFAATGEMAFALIKALGVPLDFEIATALYVAIVTDTAGFRYKRTSPDSHRIAAELLEHGVAPEQVYRSIFARESVARMRLLGHTLEGVQIRKGGRLAWIQVPLLDRQRYGATIEDTESFLGFLTLLHKVEIAAMFREEEDGRIKVSLRGLEKVPVVDIVQSLGGGGHRFAAGARVTAPLKRVVEQVLAACESALQ